MMSALAPHTLCRTPCQLQRQLPAKRQIVKFVTMSRSQASLYQQCLGNVCTAASSGGPTATAATYVASATASDTPTSLPASASHPDKRGASHAENGAPSGLRAGSQVARSGVLCQRALSDPPSDSQRAKGGALQSDPQRTQRDSSPSQAAAGPLSQRGGSASDPQRAQGDGSHSGLHSDSRKADAARRAYLGTAFAWLYSLAQNPLLMRSQYTGARLDTVAAACRDLRVFPGLGDTNAVTDHLSRMPDWDLHQLCQRVGLDHLLLPVRSRSFFLLSLYVLRCFGLRMDLLRLFVACACIL